MRVEDEIFEFFENLVAEIDTCTCVHSMLFLFLFLFCRSLFFVFKKERHNFFVSSCEIYGRILSKFEIRRLLRVDLFFFFRFEYI